MNSLPRLARVTITVAIIFLIAGCGDNKGSAAGAGGAPAEVAIVTIAPHSLTLTSELPGRLEATRVAQVRARVPGVVLERVFHEGGDVKAGSVLYRIDPAPFKAAYSSAAAVLARAEANLAQTALKTQRYKPLVESHAISKQEYDEALTAEKQAAADVAAAKAAQETARLNLGYATVTAPITGRIGRALVTEGALVGQGEATQLALVQQVDPIYVTLTQSSTDVLKLKEALASGQLKSVGNGAAKVTLVTDDGKPYPLTGKLLFSDLTVDESSGAVILRAEFPNPDKLLMPGMYVRAKLEQALSENAITVPLQAVQRGTDGASVMVVGTDNKVSLQPVKADRSEGNSWVVTQGLKAGDRVIVEGFQKTRPGGTVKPVDWKDPLMKAATSTAAASASASATTK
ncbi:MAG: efflux RND transporter periplasmic adaptor subunit [Proteobacteria bacterium]|nr:efflux RND transporter periplasmic adaptor subunit [Pseudomonadota bacterium]